MPARLSSALWTASWWTYPAFSFTSTNVLMASASQAQHAADLRQMLDQYQLHSLVLNIEKCLFGVD
jgi:hypothetical protein